MSTYNTPNDLSLRELGGEGRQLNVPADIAPAVNRILNQTPLFVAHAILRGKGADYESIQWLIHNNALTDQQCKVIGLELPIAAEDSTKTPEIDDPVIGKILQHTNRQTTERIHSLLGWPPHRPSMLDPDELDINPAAEEQAAVAQNIVQLPRNIQLDTLLSLAGDDRKYINDVLRYVEKHDRVMAERLRAELEQ